MARKIPQYMRASAHQFSSFEDMPFSAAQYSELKFGCDNAARLIGNQLAEKLFHTFAGMLLSSQGCVVVPSPYHHIKNAAANMTRFVVDRLNLLIVSSGGMPVAVSTVHRHVTYVNDYGFLPVEQRRELISNDKYYLNQSFLQGKLLICVDDIRITGTHEDKMLDTLTQQQMSNDAIFAYYAELKDGAPAPASIEADLNFFKVKDVGDLTELLKKPSTSLLVRPVKMLLQQPNDVFRALLPRLTTRIVSELFYGAIAEGYHCLPAYHPNFIALKHHFVSHNL